MIGSKTLKKIIIGIFWILLWQLIAMAVSRPLLLPGPVDTIRGLFVLLGDSGYYLDILSTIYRCLFAIVLALLFGTLLAILSYRAGIVREVLSLPVSFFKSVPIMAVAIYMVLLLRAGNVPILVCFIMCFPIVYTNLLTGLDNMDAKYYEMAVVYGLSDGRIMRYIYWPQMYPYFKSALSLISGMSWKAVVTAEVLSIPKFSLGYELMNAKYYLNTDLLFAYVMTIVVISVLFEKLVKYLLAKYDASSGTEYTISKVTREDKSKIYRAEAQPAASIELRDINKSFGDKIVLDKFSAMLDAGKTTALMAESGAGKTTLMRILIGLERADAGSISVRCGDIESLIKYPISDTKGRDMGGIKFAVLFQEDRLLPWLNAYDNLALVVEGNARLYDNIKSVNQSDCDTKSKNHIIEALNSVGLGDDILKMPGELSGGMSHRVAIARMLLYSELCGADTIIADEPFRGLDERTRGEVIEQAWRPVVTGKTVLIITHDQDIADTLADKVMAL